MRPPLRPFLATTILLTGLSTWGCTKKNDASPMTGTGSYKLDGVAHSCTTQATVSTLPIQGVSTNMLVVVLATTPQPANGSETLTVRYFKPADQLTSAYVMGDAYFVNHNNPLEANTVFLRETSTIAQTSFGNLSGTFSAKLANVVHAGGPYPEYLHVSDGAFTNARL